MHLLTWTVELNDALQVRMYCAPGVVIVSVRWHTEGDRRLCRRVHVCVVSDGREP